MSEAPLKVLAVVGSLKKNSVTRVVIQDVAEQLAARGCSVDVLDLLEHPLALYNPESAHQSEKFPQLQARVDGADVYVLGSPDYHGSISSAMKNFLDHFCLRRSISPAGNRKSSPMPPTVEAEPGIETGPSYSHPALRPRSTASPRPVRAKRRRSGPGKGGLIKLSEIRPGCPASCRTGAISYTWPRVETGERRFSSDRSLRPKANDS